MSGTDRNPMVRAESKSFRLARSDAKLFGVCGGIARYFGIDATLVRIGFALGTILGFGALILVYLAVALIAE